jgi:hypothetical protein
MSKLLPRANKHIALHAFTTHEPSRILLPRRCLRDRDLLALDHFSGLETPAFLDAIRVIPVIEILLAAGA